MVESSSYHPNDCFICLSNKRLSLRHTLMVMALGGFQSKYVICADFNEKTVQKLFGLAAK